jgi:hypothetical protein|tara:strand:- start:103 stop:333 length:231 start_codon:yes stop_codon:yes gene_type:complete
MNKTILLNGFVISFLFLIAKFIEMRFITKENLPPKILVRDALLVYVAVIVAHYIMTQLNNKQTKEFVEVFTDNPSF